VRGAARTAPITQHAKQPDAGLSECGLDIVHENLPSAARRLTNTGMAEATSRNSAAGHRPDAWGEVRC